MKQLLVPIDLGEESMSVLEYAINFAVVIDAGVTILHSYQPEPVVLDGMLVSEVGFVEEAESTFNDFFQQVESKFQKFEVPLKKKFMVGFAAESIVEEADESRAYMILMATKGVNTFKRIFGSISTEVMKKSEIPVLLIPPKFEFRLIKKLIYADDFTENHDRGLAYLEHLLKDFLADLYCVHVSTSPDEKQSWSDLSKLESRFIGVHIEKIDVKDDSVMHGLMQEAEFEDIDLIIMPSKKHGFVYDLFHKSVTREMVINSTRPILVIH